MADRAAELIAAAVRLQNRRCTRLTAPAGDVIVFMGKPATVNAVTLYQVRPVDQNERVVTSDADWLAWEGGV